MHLRTLILYPEEARDVAADTVRRVEEAPEDEGSVRPALLPDGTLARTLGLLRRDPDGGWTDHGRAEVRRWLFDPRRAETDVLDVLRHAASAGVWCVYADDGP